MEGKRGGVRSVFSRTFADGTTLVNSGIFFFFFFFFLQDVSGGSN